jgi:hypothetical protein
MQEVDNVDSLKILLEMNICKGFVAIIFIIKTYLGLPESLTRVYFDVV